MHHLANPILTGKAGDIEGALQALAAANVDEIAVTELDIEGASPAEYPTVVAACYAVPRCVGVTVWGVRDADSWKADKTPLLFNNNWEPKDAYYAIRDYLRKQQKS
jgi:endo-1,4-beta-xylanase